MNVFNTKNPNILNKFLLNLINVRNYSLTTAKEYRIDLLVFFRFIKSYNNINVQVEEFNLNILLSVRESDIIAFLVYINYYRNSTSSTRQRKLCAIKTFYNWLFRSCPTGVTKNPIKNLPSIQDVQRLPKYLVLSDAKKLKNIFTCENSKFPVRNNAIIALFLNCGLRASELININLCDINWNKCYIKIIGKGNKERICWLNSYTKKHIEKYLEIRNKNKTIIKLEEPLFLSYRNGRLSLNAVEKISKKAYSLAGLDGHKYTTHTLRHTSATIMYQYVSQDILLLKEFLGHSTIRSTEIYTHVHNNKIKNAFNSNPLSNFILKEICK